MFTFEVLTTVQTGSEQAPLQLLVEVELSNTSPHSLCMSGVQFEPAPGYEATLITRKQADEAVIAIVDPLDVDACMAAKPLLSPGASFTAVFAVSPLLAQVRTVAWAPHARLPCVEAYCCLRL